MITRWQRHKTSVVSIMLLIAGMTLPVSAQAQDPLTRFLDDIFKKEQHSLPDMTSPAPIESFPNDYADLPSPLLPASDAVPSSAIVQQEHNLDSLSPDSLSEIPQREYAIPLPPVRPENFGERAISASTKDEAALLREARAQVAPQSMIPSASATAKSTKPAINIPRTASEAIARINAYLNSVNILTARFMQTGADGRMVGGTLYVQRPGRLRFAYDPPSTLEIVADGRSVAIRDSRLRTNDVYSIGQTPLKFLLRDNIDLAHDMKVRHVSIDPTGEIAIMIEDSSTLGGTSTITLVYDARINVLKQWNIIDPQGYETSVVLSGVQVTSH